MVVVASVEVPVTLKNPVVVAFVVVLLVKVRLVPERPEKNPLVPVNPIAERLVVDALVVVSAEMNALVKVSPVPEILVVDALVAKSCPPTVRAPVVDAVESVARPVWEIEKRVVPVDDATLNGLTPDDPCTLKV
jgi:hypothetical protein